MSRAAVFSTVEKAIFNDLVSKYYKYIECKKNDAISIVEKNNAWKSLTEEFNESENVTERTEKQLRRFWDNSKSRNKKQLRALNDSVKLSNCNENYPDSTDFYNSPTDVNIKTDDSDAVVNDVSEILEVTIHSPTSSFNPIQSDEFNHESTNVNKEQTYDILKQEVCFREELHALKKRKLLAEVEMVQLNLQMQREEQQHRAILRELEIDLKKQELRHRDELQKIKLTKLIEFENSVI